MHPILATQSDRLVFFSFFLFQLCWVFFFFFFFNDLIYLFLVVRVFVAVLGLFSVLGFFSSCQERGLLSLWSIGSRLADSAVPVCGLSYFLACGIFLDQGLNLCALHWQVYLFFVFFFFNQWATTEVLPQILKT